jgi:hypothetical protein
MNRTNSNRGSTTIVALLFLGILAAVGATTFLAVQGRYRQVHQTATWQEALLAAESGIDLAVNELRKDLYAPTTAWADWSDDPNASGGTAPALISADAAYYTSSVLLRSGEGGGRSYCKVSVDAPASLRDATGEQWYRVRSLGIANVPGGRAVAGSKTDLRLRKFDFQFDRRTGARVQPQATRLIEAIVKPVGTFRLALFGVSSVDMNNHNILIDSYDSRDASKSTNGFYDAAKRQTNGNIATNGPLIDAGSARIYGSAATNGGTVLNSANVSGDIRNDFYQETFAVTRPDVVPDLGTPASLNGSATIVARAGTPTQVLVPQIQLSGQDILRIAGAADSSATFAQIIVNSDISMSGQSKIVVDPGVHVRIFVGGDADISGNGVLNPNSPLHFQLYGLDRPKNADGSPQNPGVMKVAGNGGFRGTVYAPSYEVRMVGGGTSDSIFGSFVGWTVSMTGVQAVHYDEALADGGLISDYKVVSWFEDVR